MLYIFIHLGFGFKLSILIILVHFLFFSNRKDFSPRDGINILRFLGHYFSIFAWTFYWYCVTVRFTNRILLGLLGLTVFRLSILLRWVFWRQWKHGLWLCWCIILLSNILDLSFVICMKGFEILLLFFLTFFARPGLATYIFT